MVHAGSLQPMDSSLSPPGLQPSRTHADALPPTWLVRLIVPILKVGKPSAQPESYRPVFLTSAAGNLVESAALACLEGMADQCGVLREQQSG